MKYKLGSRQGLFYNIEIDTKSRRIELISKKN